MTPRPPAPQGPGPNPCWRSFPQEFAGKNMEKWGLEQQSKWSDFTSFSPQSSTEQRAERSFGGYTILPSNFGDQEFAMAV